MYERENKSQKKMQINKSKQGNLKGQTTKH